MELQHVYNELYEANVKIYFQYIPEEKSLPIVDKKIKIAPLEDTEGKFINSFLDNLIPKGKFEDIEKLRMLLIQHITANLNKYQKPEDIDNFLKLEGLSYDINDFLDNDPLLQNFDLWKKFSEIKSNGSIDYFANSLFCYQGIHDDIETQLININHMLYVKHT
jgi:hypothetical protein